MQICIVIVYLFPDEFAQTNSVRSSNQQENLDFCVSTLWNLKNQNWKFDYRSKIVVQTKSTDLLNAKAANTSLKNILGRWEQDWASRGLSSLSSLWPVCIYTRTQRTSQATGMFDYDRVYAFLMQTNQMSRFWSAHADGYNQWANSLGESTANEISIILNTDL